MRVTGADIGGRRAVAAQHRPGPPTGQPHQTRLAAALGEPGMREGVAKLVRMQVGEGGLGAATAEHLPDAVGAEGTLAEPQPGQVGQRLRFAGPTLERP
jgi:hypothetical protein